MHSSRMRTGCSLTVCCSVLPRGAWSGGAGPGGGLLSLGGCAWSRGVCLVWGGFSREPPPVNRITDTCKNITLATTSLRPVINVRTITQGELSITIHTNKDITLTKNIHAFKLNRVSADPYRHCVTM